MLGDPRTCSAGGYAAWDQVPAHSCLLWCSCIVPAATILPYCWLQVALHQPRKRSGHVGRAGGAQKVTGCWIDSSEHKAGLKLYQRWKKPCCHLLNRKAEDFQGIQNVFLMGQIRDGQIPFGLVAPVVPSKVTDTRCRRSHKSLHLWKVCLSRKLHWGVSPKAWATLTCYVSPPHEAYIQSSCSLFSFDF